MKENSQWRKHLFWTTMFTFKRPVGLNLKLKHVAEALVPPPPPVTLKRKPEENDVSCSDQFVIINS